jgi:arginase
MLRELGLVDRLSRRGARVQDSGDVLLGPQRRETRRGASLRASSLACRQITDHLGGAVGGHAVQLVLGGDHAIGLATVTATLRRHPDAGVVWVDAHGDMNTPSTTPSGNFHGMPLGLLLDDFTEEQERGFGWVNVRLDPRRLVIIGARALDPGEAELAARLGIRIFTMNELRRLGSSRVLHLTEEHLERAGSGPVHLSLDIDALDPAHAPATGTPVEHGLTLRDGLDICRFFSRRMTAMDLVELNPELGVGEHAARVTADTALALIQAAVAP